MQQVCKRCLYTNSHPFGVTFSNDLCSGCLTHEEKYTLDWSKRREDLGKFLENHSTKSRSYDCVVPVVGDAEDYFVLETILSEGMSPLVVCVNDYFKNDIGWHNLHNLITCFDVDSFVFNPDIRIYRELVRTSLRKYDHMLLPFSMLHTSFPVHVAMQRKIPLVIWGQHQAVEQVGKFSHSDNVEMTRWSRKEHDLFNNDIEDLIGNGAQVLEHTLNYYSYPEPKTIRKNNITGIYLSNYIPWDPLRQNRRAVEHGFQPQQHFSTFDPYERAGSSVYYGIHDLLKYKRCGYRKVTDHLTREIRHGRITTEQARKINRYYSQVKVPIKKFFDWLDVTTSGYEWFVKHHLKEVDHLIGHIENSPPDYSVNPECIASLLSNVKNSDNDFILFGKGIGI